MADTSMSDASAHAPAPVPRAPRPTYVIHCDLFNRRGRQHDVRIYKSEAQADAWVVNRIAHYKMTPDPNPDNNHEEYCDTDPTIVAWCNDCAWAKGSVIHKLVVLE